MNEDKKRHISGFAVAVPNPESLEFAIRRLKRIMKTSKIWVDYERHQSHLKPSARKRKRRATQHPPKSD